MGQKQRLSRKPVTVDCPHCGHGQPESVLAISTFCRGCGEHYEITAPGKRKPERPSREKSASPRPATSFSVADLLTRAGLAPFVEPLKRKFATAGEHVAALASRVSEALPARSGPREVFCFECRTKHSVSPTAESTSCPHCGIPISLADIDVTALRTLDARTQGDVIVRRKVTLVAGIHCRNLTVHGKILGRINCSGTATFRASGNILGKVRCHRIVIPTGKSMTFTYGVEADFMEILGEATGEFICKQSLKIGKRGRVHGPVVTGALIVEPGGMLDGSYRVLAGPEPQNAASSSTRKPQDSPSVPESSEERENTAAPESLLR